MKKLLAIVMVVAMMFSMSVVASAGETASIEYDGSKAVITVSTTEAFETLDIGIISEATCSQVAQVMDFAMANAMDPTITWSAATNAAAADDAGTAYAVVTGAGYKQIDAETSEPIPYVGGVYTFTYENVAEGTEFTVVSGTASNSADVTAATVVATLKASAAPVETPVVPDETPVVPDETPVVPDETPVVPDETPVVPVETPAAPVETPSNGGSSNAPATADEAPIVAMISLVVVAGLAIVALKKKATN